MCLQLVLIPNENYWQMHALWTKSLIPCWIKNHREAYSCMLVWRKQNPSLLNHWRPPLCQKFGPLDLWMHWPQIWLINEKIPFPFSIAVIFIIYLLSLNFFFQCGVHTGSVCMELFFPDYFCSLLRSPICISAYVPWGMCDFCCSCKYITNMVSVPLE